MTIPLFPEVLHVAWVTAGSRLRLCSYCRSGKHSE